MIRTLKIIKMIQYLDHRVCPALINLCECAFKVANHEIKEMKQKIF